MSAATVTTNPPASYRNPASPADQALTKIVDVLLGDGFGFTIPAWDGDAYLRINNALRAITALTITSHGDVTWEYRATRCPHLAPSRLIGIAIGILDPDPDIPRRVPLGTRHDGFPLVEVIRYSLYLYGFTATITETGADTGPVLTVTNPARPHRGAIDITDDGELEWKTSAPHHPDGGIPLPDIAATISRTLTRAQHPATSERTLTPPASSKALPHATDPVLSISDGATDA